MLCYKKVDGKRALGQDLTPTTHFEKEGAMGRHESLVVWDEAFPGASAGPVCAAGHTGGVG